MQQKLLNIEEVSEMTRLTPATLRWLRALGPIDPQISLPNGMPMPAGALIEQFRTASEECAKDPSRISAWLPTLQQYPPGLLNVCDSAADLAKRLVAQWLETYMFSARTDAADLAGAAAEWLANDREHLSHSRALTREDLREYELEIVDLEDDQALQDAVLSVHHATMHTLGMTPATKIIENHLGRAWVQQGGQLVISAPPSQPPGFPPGTPPAVQPPRTSPPSKAGLKRKNR